MSFTDDFSAAVAIAQQSIYQLPTLFKLHSDGVVEVIMLSITSKSTDDHIMATHWGTPTDLKNNNLKQIHSLTSNDFSSLKSRCQLEWDYRTQNDGYICIESGSLELFELGLMLPNKWDPDGKQIRKWPVWIQPKLSGVRCSISIANTQVAFVFSKHSLDIPEDMQNTIRTYCAILKSQLQSTFGMAIGNIFRLDGILSRPNPHASYTYYIFDIILSSPITYEHRWASLITSYDYLTKTHQNISSVMMMPTSIVLSKEGVLGCFEHWTSQGNDGIIIRKPDESKYVGKRCSSMLKYERFETHVGKIVGCSLSENRVVFWQLMTPEGQITFNIRGHNDTLETYQRWSEHPELFLGTLYAYRFTEFNKDGITPKHPIPIGHI